MEQQNGHVPVGDGIEVTQVRATGRCYASAEEAEEAKANPTKSAKNACYRKFDVSFAVGVCYHE